MCQAIAKPADTTIDRETLRHAWEENPHGAGFAYLSDGTVYLSKGYFRFKQFWKAYQMVEHLPVVIHFRLATHGDRVAENCHPFVIATNAVMAHNGVLQKFVPPLKSTWSDTRIFAEVFLANVIRKSGLSVYAYLHSPGTLATLEELIGSSKLIFLTPEGFTILNESLGQRVNGVWYSAGDPMARLTHRGCDYRRIDRQEWQERRWEVSPEAAWITEHIQREDSDSLCTLCGKVAPRLFAIGAEGNVCRTCWDDIVLQRAGFRA